MVKHVTRYIRFIFILTYRLLIIIVRVDDTVSAVVRVRHTLYIHTSRYLSLKVVRGHMARALNKPVVSGRGTTGRLPVGAGRRGQRQRTMDDNRRPRSARGPRHFFWSPARKEKRTIIIIIVVHGERMNETRADRGDSTTAARSRNRRLALPGDVVALSCTPPGTRDGRHRGREAAVSAKVDWTTLRVGCHSRFGCPAIHAVRDHRKIHVHTIAFSSRRTSTRRPFKDPFDCTGLHGRRRTARSAAVAVKCDENAIITIIRLGRRVRCESSYTRVRALSRENRKRERENRARHNRNRGRVRPLCARIQSRRGTRCLTVVNGARAARTIKTPRGNESVGRRRTMFTFRRVRIHIRRARRHADGEREDGTLDGKSTGEARRRDFECAVKRTH